MWKPELNKPSSGFFFYLSSLTCCFFKMALWWNVYTTDLKSVD